MISNAAAVAVTCLLILIPLTFQTNLTLVDFNTNYDIQFIDNDKPEMEARLQNELHSNWKKNLESLNGKSLKVVFKLLTEDSEQVAGGTLKLSNGTVLHLEGGGVPVIWDLKEFLNLTLEHYYTYRWGVSWSMMEEGVVELEAILRTNHWSFINEDTERPVALLFPLVAMSSNVYFRPPPPESIKILLFWPLRCETWLALLALWIFSIFVCRVVQYIYKHRVNNTLGHSETSEHELFIVADLLLWLVGVISGKDFPIPRVGPEAATVPTSLRIGMFSAMCLSAIVLAAYTAKIMAFLSVKNDVIKSPEDLLKYKYTLSSYAEIHVQRIFQNVTNMNELVQKAVSNFQSGDDAMLKVIGEGKRDPRYAFLTHPDGFFIHGQLSHNYASKLCSVSSFSSQIKSPRSMYIKKTSKFREAINWKILQLIEYGINFRHQHTYGKQFESSNFCSRKERPSLELSLNQTLSLFLVLIAGASLAIGIYFVELTHSFISKLYKWK